MTAARSSAAIEDRVKQALMQHEPTSCKVWLGDDLVAEIELGKTRRKFSVFLETLEAVGAWSRLDLVGKSGKTLYVIPNDGEPGPLEDVTSPETSRAASAQVTFERAMKIALEGILRGQREVLLMRDKETATVIGSLAGVTKELTGALNTLNKIHGEQLAAANEAADHRAELNQRDWVEQLSEIAEAVPQLMPLLPMIKAALSGPGKAIVKAATGAVGGGKPPNGAGGASPHKG